MNWQADAEFKGDDFTATITLGNPDVLVGSGRSSSKLCFPFSVSHPNTAVVKHNLLSICPGIVVTHYLQSITSALALGGELVYHRRPGEEGAVMSLVGRYIGEAQFKECRWHRLLLFQSAVLKPLCPNSTGNNYIATLTLGSAGAHASYYHKANDQVKAAPRSGQWLLEY